MSEERNIDYESFRKTHLERLRDWRAKHITKVRGWWKDALGLFTQRGWCETQAEIVSCTPVRTRYYGWRSGWAGPGGWAVVFRYVIDGKAYDGAFNSMDKVEASDTFPIRYNPVRPEENNSLDSKLSLFNGVVLGLYDLLVFLLVGSLVVAGILMRR